MSRASFSSRYTTLGTQAIGEGGQAKVFLCKRTEDGEIFVLKEIDLRHFLRGKNADKSMEQLHRELDIHRTIDHPNIVRFVEYFETSDHHKIQVVLEYCSEGDVMDYMERKPQKRLDESDAKKIIYQVAKALQYLHDRELLHRDIKPENILLTSEFDSSGFPKVKLTDFGVSKELKSTIARTYTGSPIYMAPEITEDMHTTYSYPADCWSLGVALYVMLFADFPYEQMELVRDVPWVFAPSGRIWETLSEDCKALMSGLMKVVPSDRLTIQQVLASKWFESGI